MPDREPPTSPGAARPVTPVGIAAALLCSVEERLHDVPDLDEGIRADLRRAVQLIDGLEGYVEACTSSASDPLTALQRRTADADWRERTNRAGLHLEQEMLSGHVEGRLLAMLVGLTRARNVLEIGMFTGYSSLAMAEALTDGGRVVACELDPATAAFARECFDASPAGHRIQVEIGAAATTLARLAADGQRFDLVFIDADKSGYAGYLAAVLGSGDGSDGLLADGGLVCVDNTLLQGQPWTLDSGTASVDGLAIAEFNAAVASDPRVEQVLLPLRDGLTLLRRT